MPIPDDARFGPSTDPQSRKEDVAYDLDVSPRSLAEEKEWAEKYGLPSAGTRGNVDIDADDSGEAGFERNTGGKSR